MPFLYDEKDPTFNDLVVRAHVETTEEVANLLRSIYDSHLTDFDHCGDYGLSDPLKEDEVLQSDLLEALLENAQMARDGDPDETTDTNETDRDSRHASPARDPTNPYGEADTELLDELCTFLELAIANFVD